MKRIYFHQGTQLSGHQEKKWANSTGSQAMYLTEVLEHMSQNIDMLLS